MYNEININQREFNQLYYKVSPMCAITSSVDGIITFDAKSRSQNFSTSNHNLEIKMPIMERKQNTEIQYNTNNNLSATIQLCQEDVFSLKDENIYSNEDESYFPFYRKMECNYHEPKQEISGKWPFYNLNALDHAYHLTSILKPK